MTTPTKEDLEKAREIVLRDYKLKTEWTEEQLKGRVSGELAELLIASFAQALSTVREEQKEKDARIAEKHKHKMKWQDDLNNGDEIEVIDCQPDCEHVISEAIRGKAMKTNRKVCECSHPERWHELDNGACHGELDCLCKKFRLKKDK